MYIVLCFILTIISISLNILASSLDLANKVSERVVSKSNNKVGKVAKIGLATTSAIIKLSAFIVDRVRDLIAFVGTTFGLVLNVVIVVMVLLSAYSYISMS